MEKKLQQICMRSERIPAAAEATAPAAHAAAVLPPMLPPGSVRRCSTRWQRRWVVSTAAASLFRLIVLVVRKITFGRRPCVLLVGCGPTNSFVWPL